jgi:lipopolysaccharide export system protein LptC
MKFVVTLAGRYGTLGVMMALALASFWALSRLDLGLFAPSGEERHTPDFYMENFVTTKMDENGAVNQRVEADYMAHFPDTDTYEFQRPYMVMYGEEGPPWHVRSERGWLSSSGDVMLLLGKVHLWRDNASGVKELDVKTEDLRVLPERQYGETDKPVLITTATTQTRAIGMRASMAESRIELLSNVHTRHEPTNQ